MAPSWYYSKWFRLAAVVFGLLLVGLLLAPYLLDLDRYRATIVEQLEKETGRDIEIEKLRLHFLPHLGVEVVNFRLKNPRGFPPGDTAQIDSIDVVLAAAPLLSREVEIESVSVEGLEVNLLSNEQDQTNTGLAPRRRPAKKTPPGEKPLVSLSRIGSVAVEDAKVTSGTFWSGQKRVYAAWEVSGINLEAQGFDLTEPQWLRKVEAEVDLSTIKISTPALKVPLGFTDGELEVKKNAAQGKFTLALGSLRASGTLKVADLEHPVGEFTLTMKELNVAEVSAVAGGKPAGGSVPAPSSREGGGARGQLLARGSVEVGQVVVAPLSFQNVRGQVQLYSERLEVDPFTVDLYSGRTQGNLGVDLGQASLPARVTARVENVNVAQAVAAASPEAKGKITGKFEADARLGLALGATDPLAGLGGDGTFAVRNGSFPGLNVEGTLAKMARFMLMEVPKGDTRFRSFGGDFRIHSRRVHSNTLRLDSDTLEATLGGSFGFDQTLNYNGWGLLTGKGGQQQQQTSRNPLGGLRRVFGTVVQQTMGRMRVPFSVSGTFREPRFLLVGPPTPVR